MQRSLLTMVLLLLTSAAWAQSHARQAANDSGAASAKAGSGAAHAVAASGQVTSAVVAVPLSVGVVAGAASAQAGADSARASNTPIGMPLPVTDEVVTILPPSDALKAKAPPAATRSAPASTGIAPPNEALKANAGNPQRN